MIHRNFYRVFRLTAHSVRNPVALVSYHEHNKRERGAQLVERLRAGESCALVSDAGTPAISDPGEDLVKQCAEAGVTVCAIPGPCAAITALSISGQATGRFCFEGFLSTSKKSRREHLDSLKKEQRTMIFYEAPHKLLSTLEDMAEVFGEDRPISLCRELTKLHEEVVRTTLGGAIAKYTENAPKGEFVLVLAGAQPVQEEVPTDADAAAYVSKLMAGGMTRKDAERCLNAAIDLITVSLIKGEKVQLSGFGTYEVKARKDRVGRNPVTRESVKIPAKNAVTFKPSGSLKEKVEK